jgi:hypothetical protein
VLLERRVDSCDYALLTVVTMCTVNGGKKKEKQIMKEDAVLSRHAKLTQDVL